MRNIQKYAKECKNICKELGIPIDANATVEYSKRLKSSWGICHHRGKENHIFISESLGNQKLDDKGLKETIIHELLHTCDGCRNHGRFWKGYVELVNETHGFNIKRTDSCEDKGIDKKSYAKTVEKNAKYKYVCEGCGAIVIRYRESNFTKHPERYHCGKCKGKFKKAEFTKDGALQTSLF